MMSDFKQMFSEFNQVNSETEYSLTSCCDIVSPGMGVLYVDLCSS